MQIVSFLSAEVQRKEVAQSTTNTIFITITLYSIIFLK